MIAGQHRHQQVHVDAEQPLGCLAAHHIGDECAHVAALGDIAGVAEAVHQLRPGLRDTAGVPAELGRLAREAVARQGRQHQVESVLGGATVRGRVGERADRLDQLDDRARPAVRHDQRQRVLVLGPHVDEVDLDPVDLGRELRERVELRLDPRRSRTPPPSSARAPASSRAGHLASGQGHVPCWASVWLGSGGEGLPASPAEHRSGRSGSR